MPEPALDAIQLRYACPVAWETMVGDERRRHCQLCQLDVHDVSELTRDEAMRLIAERDGGVCLRFYRRPDGKVLTRDCAPIRAVRLRRVASVAAGAVVAIGVQAAIVLGYLPRPPATDPRVVAASTTALGDVIPTLLPQRTLDGLRDTSLGKSRVGREAIDWLEGTFYPRTLMGLGLF